MERSAVRVLLLASLALGACLPDAARAAVRVPSCAQFIDFGARWVGIDEEVAAQVLGVPLYALSDADIDLIAKSLQRCLDAAGTPEERALLKEDVKHMPSLKAARDRVRRAFADFETAKKKAQLKLEQIAARLDGLPPTPRSRGAVDDAEGLADAVREAVAFVSPFAVELTGGGAFPSPRRASVLWIGVREPEPLATLAGAVTRATIALGHPAEDRAYHPHLTVARAGRPRSVTPLVDELSGMGPGPTWTVSEVALVESDTRREGAVHTERARLVLDG